MPSSGVQTGALDRKSTRLNSSHTIISYAVFCLKKLDVEGTAVSDESVEGRSALTRLTALNLSNTRVTADGIDALKKVFFKCKVDSEAPPFSPSRGHPS